jgi:stalled ribosome rescue protein Dom34
MKQIGVWLDKDNAYILSIENEIESFVTVSSKVEHYNIGGGSGTRLKGGPQDVVQDRKYLEREKHQLKRYFDSITAKISDASAIVIFGPADTNEQFSEELRHNYKLLAEKIKAVTKVDYMTENQVKALVRDFFNPN